jgi:hypothetical protein
MKTLIILLAAFIVVSCAGRKPLTKSQWVGEAAWQVIHVIDWGQTLSIADNPDKYHEINPLIGKHPSRGRVNTYMLASAALHPLVTYVLPSEYRWYWLGGTLTLSTACVINNNSIGLKIGF